MVLFTSYFKEFLLGQQFQITTDHRARVLRYSFIEPVAIVAGWMEKLSMFNFQIVHRPGKTIDKTDALSRVQTLNLSATSVTSTLSSLCLRKVRIGIKLYRQSNHGANQEKNHLELQCFVGHLSCSLTGSNS